MLTLTPSSPAVNSAPVVNSTDDDAFDLHPTADEIDRALEDAYWADYWAREAAADAAIERDLADLDDDDMSPGEWDAYLGELRAGALIGDEMPLF